MHTARSLTIMGGGCLPMGVYLPGGVPTQGVGCTCPGGVPAWEGVPVQWGTYQSGTCLGVYLPGVYLPRGCTCPGDVYHVTYPIMHLMLSVCCLHTNWDTSTVHLLIYCCLVMWPARHARIQPPPPRCGQTDACKNITFANYVCG